MPEMAYTTLGDTGLEVSRLCLGCMNFGSEQPWMVGDREDSIEVIDRAFEAGINFFDTANVYSTGESEEILGEALADRDRSEVVVASKVYGRMREGPNGQGLSRKHVLDQVEDSLDRLGVDYLDLYQIHRWDEGTPVEETLSALDHLVETGKVRYVGASSMAAWKLMKALRTSDVEGYERFASLQPEYSLVRRHEEANALPVCADQGLGVLPWSPLAGGFLADKYDRDGEPESGRAAESDYMDETLAREENWTVLDAVREVADEEDATAVQVSLAWLLARDVVTAPIIGPRTTDQLSESLGALDVSLSDEQVARLTEPISPAWSREIAGLD